MTEDIRDIYLPSPTAIGDITWMVTNGEQPPSCTVFTGTQPGGGMFVFHSPEGLARHIAALSSALQEYATATDAWRRVQVVPAPVPPPLAGTGTIHPDPLAEYQAASNELHYAEQDELPQRVKDCPLCSFGNHGECDDAMAADPSRPPCACAVDDHGHYSDLGDDGAFGEAQTWDEDES